jgi:hypothetical protein
MSTPHKRIDKQACPRCGYVMDSIAPSEGFDMPMPGDITLCMKCAFVMQIDDTMHLVAADLSKLTVDQINDIIRVGRTIRAGSPSYFAEKN